MNWLEIVMAVTLAAVAIVLGLFVLRDFRQGLFYSHLGTFRRDSEPGKFWFSFVIWAVLLVVAICAAVGFIIDGVRRIHF